MNRILNLAKMIHADWVVIESAIKLGIKKVIEVSNKFATKEGNTSQVQACRLRIAFLMLKIFDEKPTELEDLELIAEEIADIYCKIKIIIDKKKEGNI